MFAALTFLPNEKLNTSNQIKLQIGRIRLFILSTCLHNEQVAQLWQRDRASSINDFRWGSIWGYYRLRSYFSRHCDTTQFTLTHHMVNKPFLLLGLAAEYRSRRRRRWCANNIAVDHHMFITLTGQLSWQRLRRSAVDLYSKSEKIALRATL